MGLLWECIGLVDFGVKLYGNFTGFKDVGCMKEARCVFCLRLMERANKWHKSAIRGNG